MRIVPSLIAAAAVTRGACSRGARRAAGQRQLPRLAARSTRSSSGPTVDTTEATTQPDLFNPNARRAAARRRHDRRTRSARARRSARPSGTTSRRSPTAPSTCRPPASASRPSIALYEWSQANSQITRTGRLHAGRGRRRPARWTSRRAAATRSRSAGRAASAARLTLSVDYFPDTRRRRRRTTRSTSARTVPGIERFGGCPPELRVVPSVGFDRTGSGVADHAPDRRPRAQGREGRRQVQRLRLADGARRRRPARSRSPSSWARACAPGGNIEIRVTLGAQRTGTYKFGATGSYFKWPVQAERARQASDALHRRGDGVEARDAASEDVRRSGARRAGVRRAGAGAARPAADGARLRGAPARPAGHGGRRPSIPA